MSRIRILPEAVANKIAADKSAERSGVLFSLGGRGFQPRRNEQGNAGLKPLKKACR